MRIEVQVPNFKAPADFEEHAARRVSFALGRVTGRITRVWLSLRDVNAHRGGIDKFCRVVAQLRDGVVIEAQDTSRDWRTSIDVAVERLGRAIHRTLARRRDRRLSSARSSAQARRRRGENVDHGFDFGLGGASQ